MRRIVYLLAAGISSVLIAAGSSGSVEATVARTYAGPPVSESIVDPPGDPCGTGVHPVLRPGDRGVDVRHLQCLLRRCGFDVPVDGNFGSETAQAVLEFQRLAGLVVDGIVGAQTWRALHTDCGAEGPETH